MDRRLIGIIFLTIVLPVVAAILALWNPMPPIQTVPGQALEIPLWWTLAYFGLFLLSVLVYPVGLFVVVSLLAKRLKAKTSHIIISITAASAIAAVILPLSRRFFAFGMLIPEDPADPLWDLFLRFLPETIVSSFVSEFLLVLGAVALPHLLTKTNEVP